MSENGRLEFQRFLRQLEKVRDYGNSGLLVLWSFTYYNDHKVVINMDAKDVIFELRTKKGLSQDELAREICVTRQAVSRWENGETVPNTETLKLL